MSDMIDQDLASCAALELQHGVRSLTINALDIGEGCLFSLIDGTETITAGHGVFRRAEDIHTMESGALNIRSKVFTEDSNPDKVGVQAFPGQVRRYWSGIVLEISPRAETPVQRETEKTT
jgi:hypothetical protein